MESTVRTVGARGRNSFLAPFIWRGLGEKRGQGSYSGTYLQRSGHGGIALGEKANELRNGYSDPPIAAAFSPLFAGFR